MDIGKPLNNSVHYSIFTQLFKYTQKSSEESINHLLYQSIGYNFFLAMDKPIFHKERNNTDVI